MANTSMDAWTDVLSVLRLLARHAEKFPATRKAEAIELRLFLRSGQTVSGWLKRLATLDKGREVVYLGVGEVDHPGWVVVPAEEIAALHIEPSDLASEALQMSVSESSSGSGEALTRLDLKRKLEEVNKALAKEGFDLRASCAWETLGDSSEERRHLDGFFEPLRSTLQKISSDRLGKEALKAISLVEIVAKADARAEWSKTGKTLRFQHDFRRPLPGTGGFSAQVEAVL